MSKCRSILLFYNIIFSLIQKDPRHHRRRNTHDLFIIILYLYVYIVLTDIGGYISRGLTHYGLTLNNTDI